MKKYKIDSTILDILKILMIVGIGITLICHLVIFIIGIAVMPILALLALLTCGFTVAIQVVVLYSLKTVRDFLHITEEQTSLLSGIYEELKK